MTDVELKALASRMNAAEEKGSGGDQSAAGTNCYLFILKTASAEDVAVVAAMNEDELYKFICDDPYEHPPSPNVELWERMMESHQLYEDFVYGPLAETMAGFCDPLHQPNSDPDVWVWMFYHMPITRADVTLLTELLHHSDWLEVISEGSQYGDLEKDPLYPAMEAAFPNRGLVDLYNRLGKIYVLWEKERRDNGDEAWKTQF